MTQTHTTTQCKKSRIIQWVGGCVLALCVGGLAILALPPGDESFLSKVQLQGDFGIDDGNFTNSTTRRGVFDLSRGASRKRKQDANEDAADPGSVLSDLKGRVVVKDGTAKFSDFSFSVPGAIARMNGTYNLVSEKIDMRGTLTTKEEVSKTTHGVKALFLKVLNPFLKNKSAGHTTPVKISGTYDHRLDWISVTGKMLKPRG